MSESLSKRERRVKCFKKHMEKFRNTYKGLTADEIKIEWIDTARGHYAPGVRYGDVVGLYDTSAFGKGKTGYLFTDDSLYWSRTFSKGVIKYSEIEKVTFYDETKTKDTDKGIIFHMKNGQNVVWEGFCSLKCGAFIKFLEEFITI